MIIPKRSLLVPSRRAFLAGAGGLAGDLLLPPHRVKACQTIAAASTAYPGQSGNPVGYAAAPGYPGSLTSHGTTGWVSGTAGNPTIYSFLDIDAGTAGTIISGSNITFIGCRFQSNYESGSGATLFGPNVECTGASNIVFNYCSFTPRTIHYASVPSAAWPSAGAGQSYTGDGGGAPFQMTASQCYCYGIYIPSGGAVTLNHCDFWGFAEGIVLGSGYAGPFVMDNCWVHDCQNAGQGAHQDGIGYLNGAAAPTNVTITNNTIAMIGNTNCIALQSASTTWNNYTINNNYLSGDESIVQAFSTKATNCSFTNNIFGTNLPYGGYLIYPLSANQPVMPSVIFSNTSGNSGNTWSGNKLNILSGTAPASGATPQWTSGEQGYYVWPDNTLHATDWV